MAESGRVVTYRELDERSNQCAWLFRELSLAAGDGIAIFMKNEVGFLETCWGAQRSGLYFTPVSSHLTADEIEYIVKDCGAKVFIASHDLQQAAAPIVERLKGPRSIDFDRQLPRAETGKLYKRRLKDRYWAGHETRLL